MTRTEDWSGATLRLLVPCHEDDGTEIEAALKQILIDVRIPAEIVLVQDVNLAKIAKYSEETELVFMPFKLQYNKPVSLLKEHLADLLPLLPVTAFVLAEKDFEIDAEPEEGKAAENAKTMDFLQDAKRFAEQSSKEVENANALIKKTQAKVAALIEKQADEESIEKLKSELDELERQFEKLYRRAARAKAKYHDAEKEAEATVINGNRP